MSLYKVVALSLRDHLREQKENLRKTSVARREPFKRERHASIAVNPEIKQHQEFFYKAVYQPMYHKHQLLIDSQLVYLQPNNDSRFNIDDIPTDLKNSLIYASSEAAHNTQAQTNWQAAFSHVLTVIQNQETFNTSNDFLNFIITIHRTLFSNGLQQYEDGKPLDPGAYRNPLAWQDEIVKQYEILPADCVEEEMNNFFTWYFKNRASLDPIILAAQTYRILSSIHPFPNGNNRTARLVMNYILMSNGYPPAILREDEHATIYVALPDKEDIVDSTTLYDAVDLVIKGITRSEYILKEQALLYCPVVQGNSPKVRKILTKNSSIAKFQIDSEKSTRLKTPLILIAVKHACQMPKDVKEDISESRDYQGVISVLIENGADINEPDKKGLTPLMEAFNNENWEMVLFLIQNGAKFKDAFQLRKYFYITYLAHLKAENNMPVRNLIKNVLDIVKLMSIDGDLTQSRSFNELVFTRQCFAENLDEKSGLSDEEIDKIFGLEEVVLRKSLTQAFIAKNWYVVTLLYKDGVCPNFTFKGYRAALGDALADSQFEIVEKLLDNAKINFCFCAQFPLLSYFCFRDNEKYNVPFFERLLFSLSYNVNQEYNGLSPLRAALINERWDLAALFLQQRNLSLKTDEISKAEQALEKERTASSGITNTADSQYIVLKAEALDAQEKLNNLVFNEINAYEGIIDELANTDLKESRKKSIIKTLHEKIERQLRSLLVSESS